MNIEQIGKKSLVWLTTFINSFTIHVGTYFKAPIYFHWSFTIAAFYFLATQSAELNIQLVLIFLSVILHEYGHIFVARYYNLETGCITLLPIGGAAEVQLDPDERADIGIPVVLGGLFVSFILSIIALIAFEIYPSPYLFFIFIFNMLMFLFNIIPAFPMDGGRLFKYSLMIFNIDYLESTRIAARIGQVLCILSLVGTLLYSNNPITLPLVSIFIFCVAQFELNMSRKVKAVEIADKLEELSEGRREGNVLPMDCTYCVLTLHDRTLQHCVVELLIAKGYDFQNLADSV